MPRVVHLVDDDSQVRAATSFLLASHGYITEVYSSAVEFLDQARLDRGCVVLDLRMPDLDGLEVLARLKELGSALPVIMLSGHGDLVSAVQAMRLGAEDFIQKPYREADLISAIERALDSGRRLRNGNARRASARALLRRLSPRERQVLQGLMAGLTNKQIALILDLSPRTVEMHRANMMVDLQLSSLSQALRLAFDAELTPLQSIDEEEAASDRKTGSAVTTAKSAAPAASEQLPPGADLLEGVTDCAMLIDRDWRVVYLNSNAEAVLGGEGSILGSLIWDSVPLAQSTSAREKLEEAADDGAPKRFELFEPELARWFDVSARPSPIGLQLCFRDITEEKKAQAALLRSDELLRQALDASGHGAWDWNIVTGEIMMSRRFLNQLGYPPAKVRGHFDTFKSMVHPDDWDRFTKALEKHFQGEVDRFACEYRLRRSDGSWCWNFDQGLVIARDPLSGEPTRMVGTACEITDRKITEARADEAMERLSLAQGGAGAGTWDLDLERLRLWLCPRSLQMHGFDPGHDPEISEDEWEASVHPDDLPQVRQEVSKGLENGATFRVQYRTIGADGRCRWVLGLGKPIEASAGRPPRLVGLNIDVTESVEASLEVRRMQSQLLHLSRESAMSEMASVLAHELNQPLTAIGNFIGGIRHSLLQSDLGDRVAAMAAIDGAESSTQHAAEIIRRMRSHAAGWETKKRDELLAKLVDDARQLSAQFDGTEARVVVPKTLHVLVDKVQIEQVLLNLLRNARHALDEVGSKEPILITATPRGDSAEVRVADRGSGVSEKLKKELFSPMMSDKPQGAGIGLSICRNLVEAHGGRIWLEDNQPSGACFCFTLPLADHRR